MLIRSIPNSSSGFTITEMLVASTMALTILAMALTTFTANRRLIRYDMDRTLVQQNLRSALDIVGFNVRLSGENLPSTFPAVEVIDGGSGADELILRRNLLDEILRLCIDLPSGSTDPLYFAIGGTTPGCIYADQTQNFNSWQAYRVDQGGQAKGYVFDPSSRLGQFFTYSGETMNGVEMFLQVGDTWSNDYFVGQSAAYALEELHFSMVDDVLEAVKDGDVSSPLRVAFGIDTFDVEVELQDGTTVTSFGNSDDWTQISLIRVSMSCHRVKRSTRHCSHSRSGILSA